MPATTALIDDRRNRLERILALARLSLAVLAALVLRIDPLAVVTALPALPSLIMAYTLYSDGSIEAEMPQGTMRFASVIELRAYLEKSSS